MDSLEARWLDCAMQNTIVKVKVLVSVLVFFRFSYFEFLTPYRSLSSFLARDAFVRTNRRAIGMILVCLSVRLGWACIVIRRCTLAPI